MSELPIPRRLYAHALTHPDARALLDAGYSREVALDAVFPLDSVTGRRRTDIYNAFCSVARDVPMSCESKRSPLEAWAAAHRRTHAAKQLVLLAEPEEDKLATLLARYCSPTTEK